MTKLNFDQSKLAELNEAERHRYLREELSKDVFTLKDFASEITQRKMNVWHNQGLLLEKAALGKWRKFNFIEYCWIHVVNELRNFEIGYPIIKNLKEALMKPINTDRAFEEAGLKDMIALIPEKDREAASAMLADPQFRDIIKKGIKLQINISQFFGLVQNAIYFRKHTSISFLSNGFFLPLFVDDFSQPNRLKHFSVILDYNFFTVSLTSIIRKFLIEDYFDNVQTRVKLLSPAEEEVFKHLRDGDCKSITVNFSNGKPELLEITQTSRLDNAQRIANIITSKGYHDIVIKAGNGKVLHYENTTKIKL